MGTAPELPSLSQLTTQDIMGGKKGDSTKKFMKFAIDYSVPLEDGLFEGAQFERFLLERIMWTARPASWVTRCSLPARSRRFSSLPSFPSPSVTSSTSPRST